MKQYQHLSNEERFYIHQAVREGKSQKDIAEQLGRSPATICREFKRNMWPSSYLYTYEYALNFVRWRKKTKKSKCNKKMVGELPKLVISLIKKYLSPEQVSGYLKKHHDISISHETIYRFVYSDKTRKLELKPYLRQGKKVRRKRYGSGARVSLIPNRTPISQRPKIVERKTRIGDWECDTVVSRESKSVLVTLVDRKSLFTFCKKVANKSADIVSQAIIDLLLPFKDQVKTLTFDNGTEFVQHERIGKALKARTYFANPYSSWERGINENTNGLIRQFFPKKTDFNRVSHKELKEAISLINNRPRKTRGYETPNQLFNNKFVPLI